MLREDSKLDLMRAGFWFAFGWCIFFVVVSLLAVVVCLAFGLGLPALLR